MMLAKATRLGVNCRSRVDFETVRRGCHWRATVCSMSSLPMSRRMSTRAKPAVKAIVFTRLTLLN